MDHGSAHEGVFGVSGGSAFRVFNSLLFLAMHMEDNSRPKTAWAMTRDYLTGSRIPPSSTAEFCTEVDALVHAELAHAVLSLQAQAFLTDEQKVELQIAREKLFSDWQRLCAQVEQAQGQKLHIGQVVLQQIDATFLSQLEWMCDVDFEKCDSVLRADILSESPLFQLFFSKGFC